MNHRVYIGAPRISLGLSVMFVLAACGEQQLPAEPREAAEPETVASSTAQSAVPMATSEPAPNALPSAEELYAPSAQMNSAEAPLACDMLEPGFVRGVLWADAAPRDTTSEMLGMGQTAVASSCLYQSASRKGPMAPAVRLDVYTQTSFQAAGISGGVEQVWSFRVNAEMQAVHVAEGVVAAWVDSEHAPDQSLLVRRGEVLFEFVPLPFNSSATSPFVPREKVVALATEAVASLTEQEDMALPATSQP